MTITALQNRVKKNISLIDDKLILEKINLLIDENSEVYILSDILLNKAEKSRKQIEDGNFLSQKEMDDRVQRWLNEK
jgi:uncharacterized membrane protein